MTRHSTPDPDKYDLMLRLADLFEATGDEMRERASLGGDILADDAFAESAELSPVTYGQAESDIVDSTTGRHGLLVRSVELEVLVEDVLAAVSRARAAATATGGWVSTEEVRPGDDDRPGYATLVLRVPSTDLDAVVTN